MSRVGMGVTITQTSHEDSDEDLGTDIIEGPDNVCTEDQSTNTTTNNDDDDEDSDEDEDEEPKLKYERLGNDAMRIIREDAATCLFVFSRFLVLGTQLGNVYVLDFNGNEIRKFPCQQQRVNSVGVDKSGEYIVSCGDDGRVVVSGLYSPDSLTITTHSPLKFVVIDPNYKNKTNKTVIHGGPGPLQSTTKTWLATKHHTISHNDDSIHALQWGPSSLPSLPTGPPGTQTTQHPSQTAQNSQTTQNTAFLAYATPSRVVITDPSRNFALVSHVPVNNFLGGGDGQQQAGSEGEQAIVLQHRCCLCWESESVLIIAWGDQITIVRISTQRESNFGGVRTPQYVMEYMNRLTTAFWISGLSPFGPDLVALAYYDLEEDGTRARPEIKLLSRSTQQTNTINDNNAVAVEITSDTLKVRGFEHYNAKDYRLDSSVEEALHFVVSPRDIVIARQRDLDDHIGWLLKRAKDTATKSRNQNPAAVCRWYEQACRAALANENALKNYSVMGVGEMYLNYLLGSKQFATAAQWCAPLLRRDPKLWDQWIIRFSFVKQLPTLSPHIPTDNPRLGSSQYEMVLGSFLTAGDYKGFLQLIEKWPSSLYDRSVIIATVESHLEEHPRLTPLTLALARLFSDAGQFAKALNVYLTLPANDAEQVKVFKFIQDHNLFAQVENKAAQLLKLNSAQAIQMLVEQNDKISIDRVVKQLSDSPFELHQYLHALFKKDARIAAKHHTLQLRLYADYGTANLLTFLRASDSYPLEEARRICEEKQLYRELVYVLDRMGSVHEALELLIKTLGDVKAAIEFVVEKKDDTLWDTVISHSLRSPDMVAELLEHMTGQQDPLQLIRRIPIGKLTNKNGVVLESAPPIDGGELVQDIDHCCFGVNTQPAVIVFLDAIHPSRQKQLENELRSAAVKRQTRHNTKRKTLFFSVLAKDKLASALRWQLGLPQNTNTATNDKGNSQVVDGALEMVYMCVPDDGRYYVWVDQVRNQLTQDMVDRFISACEYQQDDSSTTLRQSFTLSNTLGMESRQLGMVIPKVKEKLTTTLRNSANEVRLLEGCSKIIDSDCSALSHRLHTQSIRGIRLYATCAMCSHEITAQSLEKAGEGARRATIFFCGHAYHQGCLASDTQTDGGFKEFCPTCQSAAKSKAALGRARPSVASAVPISSLRNGA